MPREKRSESSDLSVILQSIRRRIWVVVICLVAAIGVSILLTLKAEKQYAASSSVLLRPSSAFEPQRTVETNLQLLGLPVLAARTAQKLPSGYSKEVVEKSIEAAQQGESDIVEIKATTNNAEIAAEMANTYADEFLAFKEGASDEATEGEEFGEEAEESEETEGAASSVRIVERATPEDTPVSPKPAKNVIFGGLIGLVLGLGLALLLEQLDRRVKREDDLPDATSLPVLTTIPRRKGLEGGHIADGTMSPAEAEIFLMLRANLRYFNVRRDIRSILVTSAAPGEGKSTVAIGLAFAAAVGGEKALLIEADMRNPSIASSLGLSRERGLSLLLSSEHETLDEAVVSVPANIISESAENASFDVLTSGPIPPNPTELAGSPQMRTLIAEAESSYDLVLIDSPPLLVVADTIPLVSSVGGVLTVGALGISTKDAVSALADRLEMMEAPTLGMVANFAAPNSRSVQKEGYGRPPEMLSARKPRRALVAKKPRRRRQ